MFLVKYAMDRQLPILKTLMATNFQLLRREDIVLSVMNIFHPGLLDFLK